MKKNMDFKLLAPLLALYAAVPWINGNPRPILSHENIDMSMDEIVNVNEEKKEPYSIKDVIPRLERKSRDLGV